MRAVLTTACGADYLEIAALTNPLIAAYARRLNADFIALHESTVTPPAFEKFRLYDFLGVYERIIYLDSDLIVNDHCPDLFAAVPPTSLGAWLASQHTSVFDQVIAKAQSALGNIDWAGDYFNSGVMVLSRAHRDVFRKPYNYCDIFKEQTLLNYRVQKARIPVFDIGWRANHTRRVERSAERLDSYIIHYAGLGHVAGMERLDQIRQDLVALGKI
jgi:lipopolysaccharide biosynthesis glycosyltransferase